MRNRLILPLMMMLCLMVTAADASVPAEEIGATAVSGPDLKAMVWRLSGEAGVNPRLVDALIRVESGYNPRAVSRKGAVGMMQLMPDTARRLRVQDPFDPEENVRGGIQELSRLLSLYSGNIPFALAAYNAGAGAVRKYGGIPPYGETRRYVRKIMGMYTGRPYSTRRAAPVRVRMIRDAQSGTVVITNHRSGASAASGALAISSSGGGALSGGFGR